MQWAGHRNGGVRRPFVDETGRPTENQIKTNIVKKLDSWVSDIVSNKSGTPNVVLLVGGPGNGKTDAVEGCIDAFDKKLKSTKLREKFSKEYDVSTSQLCPRKVSIRETISNEYEWIDLVQDATEGDPHKSKSAEMALVNDLKLALDKKSKRILLCCVNRGILASARDEAISEGEDDVKELIEKMTNAVACNSENEQCWPLEKHEHIAVWPMDIESLVAMQDDGKSYAHEMFEKAIDPSKWNTKCSNVECPFCLNAKLLRDDPDRLSALIKTLRAFELATGKRWTFRDLFSLISYILAGEADEFKDDSNPQTLITPCQWAENIIKNEIKRGSLDMKLTGYFKLLSRLYYHRLFSGFPIKYKAEEMEKEIHKGGTIKSGLNAVGKIVDQNKSLTYGNTKTQQTDLSNLLQTLFVKEMDPLFAEKKSEFNSRKFEQVNDDYSVSISNGNKSVKSEISILDMEFLEIIAQFEEELLSEDFVNNAPKESLRLLKNVATAIWRRSVGAKNAIHKNHIVIEEYEQLLVAYRKQVSDRDSNQKQLIKRIKASLKKYLSEEKGFRAGHATTFGQPLSKSERSVFVEYESIVKVTLPDPGLSGSETYPEASMPYLKVDGIDVPLTFDIFCALKKLDKGIDSASLHEKIFARLDLVKAQVSGKMAKNNENTIIIGQTLTVDNDNGDFSVQK